MGEQGAQPCLVDAPLGGQRAVAVVALRAAGEGDHRPVDERVAGTAVEGQRVGVRVRQRRQERHIGDPAQVLHGAPVVGMAQQQPVQVAGQGRALAPGGHVTRAEVAHRGDPGALGDDGRLADLQRGAYAPVRLDHVPDRLAVRADQVHLGAGQPGGDDGALGGGGEMLAQVGVELAQRVDRAVLRLAGAVNPALETVRIGVGDGVTDARVQVGRRAADLAHGGVDAVGGRARNEPDDDHA